MTSDRLSAASFAGYSQAARHFAVEHLALLQRLPTVLCPSFLQQIQGFDTLFPAERTLLQWQCDALAHMPTPQFEPLIGALVSLSIPDSLKAMDWVSFPARFITELTAYLWSSGQLNKFREGTSNLFSALPAREDSTSRLVVAIVGQNATVDRAHILRKLRQRGVMLSALEVDSTFHHVSALMQRAQQTGKGDPYACWYVDGGQPHPELVAGLSGKATMVTYPGLSPIREHVLGRVQATIATGTSGPEQMRTRLMETSVLDAGARTITSDPILQRFYTELFTESSGPQIFSTSFVQWTGRELARRAQPQTLVLRYAPRQHHQDMNSMFAETAPKPDPQGSLRDAEMGAYYNWIEMGRITAPGKLTFIAWVEGQPLAVMLGHNAPAGTSCGTPMTLSKAVETFG